MNAQHTSTLRTTITNLLFAAFALCAITSVQAQDRLVVKGNISSQVNTEDRTEALLIASDGEQMQMDISKKGNYMVNVPAQDSYILRFSKNGCITKEVAVDARNANAKTYGERTVRLDVTLDAQDQQAPMQYSGAALELSFSQLNRDLRLEKNALVPVVAFNDQASNGE
ncbi:MAG: hypothetical protein IPI91_09435 [Flavobacteriales bacterium]|nr:hypothetical protein [Flavobacteriales bacterium]